MALNSRLDTVIVGAGPCGLSCALELSEGYEGSVLLLEEKQRVGGEGALSDGKFKTSPEFCTPFRRGLWSPQHQHQLHERFMEVFRSTEVPYIELPDASTRDRKHSFYDQEEQRIASAGLVDFEVRREEGTTLHVGTDKLQQYVQGIVSRCSANVHIAVRHCVESIEQTDDGFRVLVNGMHIDTKNLVLAPGRRKTSWFLEMMHKLQAHTFEDEQLIGGRVVVPADSLWSKDAGVIAPCYRDTSDANRTFNFCTCEQGFLQKSSPLHIQRETGEVILTTVNGYSCAGKKSPDTNFALLTELRNSDTGNRSADTLIDFVERTNAHPAATAKTISVALQAMIDGKNDDALADVFPAAAYNRLRIWLQKLAMLYPGIASPLSRFVIPEVKLRGTRIQTDSDLRPITKDGPMPGLFIGGDAGVGTNLYDAHVQGIHIGQSIRSLQGH